MVRVRRPVEWGNGCDRRRIQRWQIIMYRLWIGNDDFEWSLVGTSMPRGRTRKLIATRRLYHFMRLEAFGLNDDRSKVGKCKKSLVIMQIK